MTLNFPLISIIVPVYKAEEFLAVCIESILSQSFKDFELILVDDGSPDNSGKICDKYALLDNRIRVIHKKNGGASSARNAGLDIVKGRYIGWVDADDRIEETMYERLYHFIEKYNADIAECQMIIVRDGREVRSGKAERVVNGSGDFILKEFFNARMKPGLVTKLYRRELWEGIIFPSGRIHQDCYINMRFALLPLRYVRIPEPLYYYLMHDNSITTTSTSREMRQALYLYEYTMNLAKESNSQLAAKYLKNDAINRLIIRYFEVSVNSNMKDYLVYNRYIRKLLGRKLIVYLITADLPIKTRVSISLLFLNLKGLQVFIHNYFGKK